MNKIRKIFLALVIAQAAIVVLLDGAQAAERSIDAFDKATSYDIYFYCDDDSKCVVKNVEIDGFQDIYGKTFLVIKPFGFKLKDTDGFILFDSVSAILPNQDFRVNSIQQIDFRK